MRKQPITKGMTVNDILNIDINAFNKLTESELRQVVSRLASAGNKRIKSFKQKGKSSPAIRYVERSGGNFSTKGKDLNALRAEYMRAKNFFGSKTSTLTGWKTTEGETVNTLSKYGITVTKEQFDAMWRAYEELKELSPEVANRGLKYTVLKNITDMMVDDNKSGDDIVSAVHEKLSQIYEEQMELIQGDDSISNFFEI